MPTRHSSAADDRCLRIAVKRLTTALDALGACSQDCSCQSTKIGVQVLNREVDLAHSSMQDCTTVSPAQHIAHSQQALQGGAEIALSRLPRQFVEPADT